MKVGDKVKVRITENSASGSEHDGCTGVIDSPGCNLGTWWVKFEDGYCVPYKDFELTVIEEARIETMSDQGWTVGNPPKGVPERCPLTGLKFFSMEREQDGKRMVPTYGGPFESYTTPHQNEDGDWVWEHFDHDEGGWVDGTEMVPEGLVKEARRRPEAAMSDRLTKAKAIAALEKGVWVEYNQTQNAWYFDIPHSARTAWGETPMEALAAAADALGLIPDPDILSGGVQLMEEEHKALSHLLSTIGVTRMQEHYCPCNACVKTREAITTLYVLRNRYANRITGTGEGE